MYKYASMNTLNALYSINKSYIVNNSFKHIEKKGEKAK